MDLPKWNFKENLANVGSEAGRMPEAVHSLWLLSLGRRLEGRKPHSVCTQNFSPRHSPKPQFKGLFSSSYDKICRTLTTLCTGNLGHHFMRYKITSNRQRQKVTFQGEGSLFECLGVTVLPDDTQSTEPVPLSSSQCKSQSELLDQLCSSMITINSLCLYCIINQWIKYSPTSYHGLVTHLVDWTSWVVLSKIPTDISQTEPACGAIWISLRVKDYNNPKD